MNEKSATLIEKFFVSNPSFKYLSGNITTLISDHLPLLIILENFKDSNLKQEQASNTYRHFRYFNIDSFKKVLQEINGNFATENSDVELGFEIFFGLFNKALDRHTPIKNTWKEKKLSLSPGLQKA